MRGGSLKVWGITPQDRLCPSLFINAAPVQISGAWTYEFA